MVERLGVGVVVPPEQPDILARTILELSWQPQRIAQIKQLSRSAAAQFSRSRQAAKMLEILQAAAASRGLPASSKNDSFT
jgi:hypothetical protein